MISAMCWEQVHKSEEKEMPVRYFVFALFAALLAVVGGSAVAEKKQKEQPKQETKAPAPKDGYMKAAPTK